MYYSYSCKVCGKVFFVYSTRREDAAPGMYNGMLKHIREYEEDHSEYDFYEEPHIEIEKLYNTMIESENEPNDGYPLA